MSSRRPTPTRSRRLWPYLAVAALFWIVPGPALVVGYLTLPDYTTSGQCEGVGGSLRAHSKGDGTQFLAMFIYPFIVAAGLLIMGATTVTSYLRAGRLSPR